MFELDKSKNIIFRISSNKESILNDMKIFITKKSKLKVEENGFVIDIKNAKLYFDYVNEETILSF